MPRPGRRVAATLAGAWRADPPPLASDGVPASLVPALVRFGCAPLVWRRLARAPGGAPDRPDLAPLRLGWLQARAQAPAHEGRLRSVVVGLADAGITPVLAKGWAAAALYPHPGLRPFGDVDLWLPRTQHAHARAVLGMGAEQAWPVDFHDETDLPGLSFEDVLAEAGTLDAGGIPVRIPSPLHHLAILADHGLREGFWRPLWLCDVAAAVEALPPGEPTALPEPERGWTTLAARLAADLLGARLPDGWGAAEGTPPAWAVAATVRQWEAPRYYMQSTPVGQVVARGTGLRASLALRWPNPLSVVVRHRRSFGRRPPLCLQVVDALGRLGAFVTGR